MDIIIWGCNSFSACLVKYLANSDFNVVAFIDPTSSAKEFCRKPVYSPDVIKGQFTRYPIIIASPRNVVNDMIAIDFESVLSFKRLLSHIVNNYSFSNILLHPAALVDYLCLDFSKKIVPFGMPGSGITLFSNICNKIIGYYPAHFDSKDRRSIFFERLCLEYTQCVNQVIVDFSHLVKGTNVHMASWKVGTTFAICTIEDFRTEIYSFATRNHILGPVYGYHQIPSDDYMKRLVAQKFNLFYIMRNPLDMILSNINKVLGVNKQTKEINMDIFCNRSVWVMNQLKRWLPVVKNLKTFLYDQIVVDPVANIKEIMRVLGLKPSDKIANEIWSGLSYKQLPSAPAHHFWRGGVGNWESFFRKEHYAFLKAQGIEELLYQYGAHETLRRYRGYAAPLLGNEWESQKTESILNEIERAINTYYGDESRCTWHLIQNDYGAENCKQTSKLYLANKNKEALNRIKSVFETDYISKLVNAGAFSSYYMIT